MHVPQAIDMDLFTPSQPCHVLHYQNIDEALAVQHPHFSNSLKVPDNTPPQVPGLSSAQDRVWGEGWQKRVESVVM